MNKPQIDQDGTKRWYNEQGQLHRDDGPAVEWVNGTKSKEWFQHGKRHREDGPAIEDANGEKYWYQHDKRHREDGPAVDCANGTKKWFQHDKLHREDGPAAEYANGDKRWYQHGKRHREEGPAIEYADGSKEWYQHDQCHRVDGPAVEYADGTKIWYQHDKKHREDGPAVEYANGTKKWFQHDKLHREDGPAAEYANGDKRWYQHFLYDIEYSEQEYLVKVLNVKSSEEKMSTSKSFMDHMKSDVTKGSFRVAAKSIPKTARVALLVFMKTKKAPRAWIKTAKEVMETEWGLAFIQQILAWGFRYFPMLKDDARAQALADEWAIDSIATVGNEIVNELMGAMAPVIAQVMDLPLPPNQVRIEEKSKVRVSSTEKFEGASTDEGDKKDDDSEEKVVVKPNVKAA